MILELQLKGFSIEAVPAYSFHPMYIIASLLLPLSVFHKFIRLQSVAVKVFAFAEVAQVELDFPNQILVVNFEVIPTSMSTGVCITPQEQVKLIPLDSHSYVQIA